MHRGAGRGQVSHAPGEPRGRPFYLPAFCFFRFKSFKTFFTFAFVLVPYFQPVGLALTNGNRMPANSTLCAHRLPLLLHSAVEDFPGCYMRGAITPQDAVRDCEARIYFLFGSRSDVRRVERGRALMVGVTAPLLGRVLKSTPRSGEALTSARTLVALQGPPGVKTQRLHCV